MNDLVRQKVGGLIPDIPPAFGQETAQVVLDIIRQFPEYHDQANYTSLCGTTHCVAGWVQVVHGMEDYAWAWDAARQRLGISMRDAKRLFHGRFPKDHAIRALEYLAKGDPIDWHAINSL